MYAFYFLSPIYTLSLHLYIHIHPHSPTHSTTSRLYLALLNYFAFIVWWKLLTYHTVNYTVCFLSQTLPLNPHTHTRLYLHPHSNNIYIHNRHNCILFTNFWLHFTLLICISSVLPSRSHIKSSSPHPHLARLTYPHPATPHHTTPHPPLATLPRHAPRMNSGGGTRLCSALLPSSLTSLFLNRLLRGGV